MLTAIAQQAIVLAWSYSQCGTMRVLETLPSNNDWPDLFGSAFEQISHDGAGCAMRVRRQKVHITIWELSLF